MGPSTIATNTKIRQSNIELLRMIAMFMVLIVHADFFSLGAPSPVDCINAKTDSILRVFFEQLTIPCVDIFVCISGWFGIKTSFKGGCNFLFQCVLWLTSLYIIALLIGTSDLSIEGIRGCFFATTLNWFIKAYLLLYILSPVLNSFVEHSTKGLFKAVLTLFFIFQTIYGWFFPGATGFIQGGYSTLSFIGLYLLMRYLRIHKPSITNKSKAFYLTIIVSITLLATMLYVIPPMLGLQTTFIGNKCIDYISPTCILIAVFYVLLFSKLRINSRAINWIATSSFAVFLIHTNPNTLYHYKDMIIFLHSELNPFSFWIATLFVLVLVYAIAVIIDKGRIALWNVIWPKLEKIKVNHIDKYFS